jgi:hypothetical protein
MLASKNHTSARKALVGMTSMAKRSATWRAVSASGSENVLQECGLDLARGLLLRAPDEDVAQDPPDHGDDRGHHAQQVDRPGGVHIGLQPPCSNPLSRSSSGRRVPG